MMRSWWSGGVWLVLVSGGNACSNAAPESVAQAPAVEGAVAQERVSASDVARTDALKRAVLPRLSRSGQGLQIDTTPAGSRRIALDGRFRSVHVLTRTGDGKKRVDCVTSQTELAARLAPGVRR